MSDELQERFAIDVRRAEAAIRRRRERRRESWAVFAAFLVVVGCFILIAGCGDPQNLDPVYEPQSDVTVDVPMPTTTEPWVTVVLAPADAQLAVADRVDPPDTTTTLAPSTGPEMALARWGADEQLIRWAVGICQRESHCTLDAHRFSVRTRDDSYGPWQLNFYGDQAPKMARLGITREMTTADWDQAAGAFLILYHVLGRCAWTAPDYCS